HTRSLRVWSADVCSADLDISANGSRVRFTRDVASITMDLNGVERINFNALDGADTITVNDLTGTDATEVNLNLKNSAGSGDGQEIGRASCREGAKAAVQV